MKNITILFVLFFIQACHSKDPLKDKLSPIEYAVTQKEETEPPFKNKYWDHKDEGIYVDVVTGEALFSSLDKYDSGTGWPSFTKPIKSDLIVKKTDLKLGVPRVEIKSKKGKSHLGHVFNDGPVEKGGQRFCVNSASLKFIPKSQLREKGYGEYMSLFEVQSSSIQTAYLAGGCFWGMEDIIRKIPGVLSTDVGYSGGDEKDAKYEYVKKGETGHAESIKVVFDSLKISYEEILNYFFRLHDPTTLNQQGNDRGTQYRSAIFYVDENQKKVALEVIKKVDASKKWPKPIVTEVTAFKSFYLAEEYHQDYLEKNPGGYTCHWLRK